MQKEFILFDWDGCLANTLPIWLKAYKRVFATYNVFPTDEEIVQKAFGNWGAAAEFGISDKLGFGTKLRALALTQMPTVGLHEHAKAMLAELKKQNKKIAIVTSSKKENVLPALKHNNIEKYFDTVICMEDITNDKPHPEMLEKALEILSGDKEQAIIIGDSIRDIGAGKNAGIATAVYYPEANHVLYTEEFVKSLDADYIVTDFRELAKIL